MVDIDPTKTVEEIRSLLDIMKTQDMYNETMIKLLLRIEALDKWLSKGNALPLQWNFRPKFILLQLPPELLHDPDCPLHCCS